MMIIRCEMWNHLLWWDTYLKYYLVLGGMRPAVLSIASKPPVDQSKWQFYVRSTKLSLLSCSCRYGTFACFPGFGIPWAMPHLPNLFLTLLIWVLWKNKIKTKTKMSSHIIRLLFDLVLNCCCHPLNLFRFLKSSLLLISFPLPLFCNQVFDDYQHLFYIF